MAGVIKAEKRADHNFQRKVGTNEDSVREANRSAEKLTRHFEAKSNPNGIRQQETVRGKFITPKKTGQ